MYFREYLRRKWIDLRQTKFKMIIGPLHISLHTFHRRKCFFCDNLLSVMREGRMSQYSHLACIPTGGPN